MAKRYPMLVVDEHIPPSVAASARQQLRAQEAARRNDLRGRDERSYIGELYSENSVFITSDYAFAEEISGTKTKHAGIICERLVDTIETRKGSIWTARMLSLVLSCSHSAQA